MPSSSPNNMEKKNQPPPQLDPLHPLKCPRCDSSNTKFCYYNNYSLSQPRHFCKACKRYWTRGGTLRNVPVGGGCRKNKRTKRPSSSASAPDVVAPHRQIDLSSSNPNLFYNTSTTNILNFPFSNFRVSNPDHNSGFATNPHQMSGFSSTGFKPIQDHNFSGNNNHNSFFFGSSSTSTMASLLASSFQHPPSLNPYEDPVKDHVNPNPNPNPIDQIHSSDPSLWNNTNLGSWFDPGPSVPSLI